MAKKRWQQPKLIILARANPEEAVLTNCKGTKLTAAGQNSACQNFTAGFCQPTCNITTAS